MKNLTTKQNTDWHLAFKSALTDLKVECQFFYQEEYSLLRLNDAVVVNLVSIENNFSAAGLIALQEHHHQNHIKLIHLWEDVWRSRSKQVVARIESILGKNIRIHGRKTKVEKIDKPLADQFMDNNHLQGAVSSRFKLGLFEKDNLVAVATFSALRKMKHSENYRSAELIRFAVEAGFSVTGGLSKLINHFVALHQPNDIMSYADRDWSAGEAYATLNFKRQEALAPQRFSLNENLKRTLIKAESATGLEVFNTGSLKFILKF